MAATPETMRLKVQLSAPPDTTFTDDVFADQVGHSFDFSGQSRGAKLRGAVVSEDGRSVELEFDVPAAGIPVNPPGSFSIGIERSISTGQPYFEGLYPVLAVDLSGDLDSLTPEQLEELDRISRGPFRPGPGSGAG
jgi:hypothetical protein